MNRITLLEWSKNKNNRIILVKRLIDLISSDIEIIRLSRSSITTTINTYICIYINSDLDFLYNQGLSLDFKVNGMSNYGVWLGDIIPELVKYKQRQNSNIWFPLGDHILIKLEYRLDALKKCLIDLHLNN